MNSRNEYHTKDGTSVRSEPKLLGLLFEDIHLPKHELLVYQLVGATRNKKVDNATFFALYPPNEKISRVASYFLETSYTVEFIDVENDTASPDFEIVVELPSKHMAALGTLVDQDFDLFAHWRISNPKSGPPLTDKVKSYFGVQYYDSYVFMQVVKAAMHLFEVFCSDTVSRTMSWYQNALFLNTRHGQLEKSFCVSLPVWYVRQANQDLFEPQQGTQDDTKTCDVCGFKTKALAAYGNKRG